MRELLGHGVEARCLVAIRKWGSWHDVGLEVEVEVAKAGGEVEIRVVVRGEGREGHVVGMNGMGID